MRRWKLLLNLATLAALALLVFFSRDQLGSTLGDLKHINLWILALLIPIELLNYHGQTKLYQHLFAVIGTKLKYRFLFRTSLELNFVNHIFPSGGVTGISYFGLRMRRDEQISGVQATLVQVMKLALTFLSFQVLIIVGLIALAVVGKVNGILLLVGTALSTLLLVGNAIFAYIVGDKRRINASFLFITRLLNRLLRVVRPKSPETINIDNAKGLFNDFHNNYQLLRHEWRSLRWPFAYAFIMNATEVAAAYVVYLAFGDVVNIGAVILAYAVANFAGLVSVLPGGVGVYEALMISVLGSAGIPPGLSLPATVMYRIVTTIIQVPPGYYYYQKTLAESGAKPADNHA
ncbi:MAG: hypothetical protein JWN38_1208 [Candidatus Saccharibacteria bacterium]|nr:hypothetical protein [Candidatus Saccharibacteria bacterium]